MRFKRSIFNEDSPNTASRANSLRESLTGRPFVRQQSRERMTFVHR